MLDRFKAYKKLQRKERLEPQGILELSHSFLQILYAGIYLVDLVGIEPTTSSMPWSA
jgi:hypothetical protein